MDMTLLALAILFGGGGCWRALAGAGGGLGDAA